VPQVTTDVDVSVVVATRNRAALLPDCLRSLTTQSGGVRFEILLVDNGSRDGTAQVIREWTRRDGRIRAVQEPRVGLSLAKNAGIRNSHGQLVLFTDDDVVLPQGWIAAYVDFFRRQGGRLVVAGGPVLPVPHDLSAWPPWIRDTTLGDLPRLYYGEAERALREFEWLWGANMAARRELFEELGLFRVGLGRGSGHQGTYEDVELADRVRAAGGEAWYCPDAPVHHRVRPSLSRPRALLLTAFNRGANDRVSAVGGYYFEAACPVPRSRVAAAFALPVMLTGLALSAAIFRLAHRPFAFDLSRRFAWGAGWCMFAVVGESSRRRARIVRWLAVRVRQAAVRVTPA
jgi:glycosyltransferase involved in cell wall biosynthesis